MATIYILSIVKHISVCVCVNVIYKYVIILYQGLEHLQNLEFYSSFVALC